MGSNNEDSFIVGYHNNDFLIVGSHNQDILITYIKNNIETQQLMFYMNSQTMFAQFGFDICCAMAVDSRVGFGADN